MNLHMLGEYFEMPVLPRNELSKAERDVVYFSNLYVDIAEEVCRCCRFCHVWQKSVTHFNWVAARVDRCVPGSWMNAVYSSLILHSQI